MERLLLFIKENIKLLIGAAVVIFVAILIISLILGRKSTKVIVNGQSFNVSVAKSEKQKEIGLSQKKSLGKNQGMLFPFDKPDYYTFWMKNMQFPIDIVYMNGNKVITVIGDAKPVKDGNLPIYQPKEKSDKVLEINAGLASQYKIQTGSTIKIENL